MTQYGQYAVVETEDEQDFNRVVAYGFVTEEGAEGELEAIEERNPDGDYGVVEYPQGSNVKLYYDGEEFSRTVTGAEERASQ